MSRLRSAPMRPSALLALMAAALLSGHGAHAQTAGTGVAEQMREDAAALTPWSFNSATVRREPGKQCMGFKPFEFLACGPMTTLTLALMPGMYGSFSYTTARGGGAAQFLDAIAGMAGATTGNTLAGLAEQADRVDGSTVTIAMPLIDYGFSGTFNNAAISMSRAGGDDTAGVYQAVGPRDALPGDEVGFPLTGSVTIEEYSPVVLRGSFSANFVDPSEEVFEEPDPELPVLRSVSGTFSIAAPWRGDDRAKVRPSEEVERAARLDMASALGVRDDGIAAQSATATRGPGPGLAQAARGGVLACDCSCNYAETALPQCADTCGATFEACRGVAVAGISDEALEAQAALGDAVSVAEVELRDRFIELLEDRHGHLENYESMRDSLLSTFDGLSFGDKAILYVTQGGEAECPPPEPLAEALGMYALMFCP